MNDLMAFDKLSPNGLDSSIKNSMRGFTLLEMMVVLVVASIMLSVATLSLMPNAQTVLHEESQRLAFLMEERRDEFASRRATAGVVRYRQ